jgi:ZIP family zinc transporter
MLGYLGLLTLAAVAGFTIFIGLPIALLGTLSRSAKGFLSAFATGILVFLIVDVFSSAWAAASSVAVVWYRTGGSSALALTDVLMLFAGLALGLLGLVYYESRFVARPAGVDAGLERVISAGQEVPALGGASADTRSAGDAGAYRLAIMTAIGIGAHNLGEGLAIGQSYASGAIGLALVLIAGFGVHNTTEGFGIAAPLAGLLSKPRLRFLFKAGLIGGGPTFVGTIVGSFWISTPVYILFLSIAGGSLIYTSLLIYSGARRHVSNAVLMTGVFLGVCAGFLTDLLVTLGGA